MVGFYLNLFRKRPDDRSGCDKSLKPCPLALRMKTGSTIMNQLSLHRVNDQVFRVLSSQGEHVGYLKLIGGAWKFKAIGQDSSGHVIPGGGPLTGRHNTVFAVADESSVSAGLNA